MKMWGQLHDPAPHALIPTGRGGKGNIPERTPVVHPVASQRTDSTSLAHDHRES
jgi:hypothetical protein